MRENQPRTNTTRVYFAIALASLIVGCGQSDIEPGQPISPTRDCITTTFYPTTWMAEQVVGSSISVECIVPADADLAMWRPDEAAIQKLQSSKLIVLNGAGLEDWVTTTTLPVSRVLDTTAELSDPFIQYENVITHQHGPAGDQSREGIDEHTWLDPVLAKHQATRIADAVKRQWPQQSAEMDANLRSVHEQLDALDTQFKELTPKLATVRLLCAQPAFNYIARRYGWKIEVVDLAKTPEADLKAMTNDTPTLLLSKSGEGNEKPKGRMVSVRFNIGTVRPTSGDYLTLMKANLDGLRKAIETATKDKQ